MGRPGGGIYDLAAAAGRQVRRAEKSLRGLLMDAGGLVTLAPAAVATFALVFLAFGARAKMRWLALAALVLMVLGVAVTSSINLPINSDQLDWSVRTPPPTGRTSGTNGNSPT
ncbi:anthrone oxygenase family protein [Streptomyces sp. NPDC055140]